MSFLEDFRHAWPADGLWNRQPLSKPMYGKTKMERLFDNARCADILRGNLEMDPVRLRMARAVLYHQYEQLALTCQVTNRCKASCPLVGKKQVL